QRRAAQQLLGDPGEELQACGHLPHLDQAALVAQRWRGQ
ncbi:MAG: alpha/beta hydrolase, partial [Synechococcaceae bacterium WB6_3B_236]|nr:alpha/beta hydrolase [Synechococcaceae bacterium WB6_3B_236]